jgi:tetratricopeptide (TPR) repeat protein
VLVSRLNALTTGSPAHQLYQQSSSASAEAHQLERRNNKRKAADAFETSARLAEQSVASASSDGVQDDTARLEAEFRCATSYLHAARLLHELGDRSGRVQRHAEQAVIHFGRMAQLEARRAERERTSINPNFWRVENGAAYAAFLRGDLARARTLYQQVLKRNPGYVPAEEAIEMISKLEQRRNEQFSPQGPTSQKRENWEVFANALSGLKVLKDIVNLGK